MSAVCRLGDPNLKDAARYATVSSLFHSKQRMLAQPNSGIAADQSKRMHKKLGFLHKT